MKITETKLNGCYLIEPTIFEDKRGYFLESYNQKRINEAIGYNIDFVQDNESQSKYGVIRGLHLQRDEFSQAKLVRVIKGSVLDVAVDGRKNSPTYGQYISVELSGQNKKQLFIPRGFLHGFSVLSEVATFFYKCDNFYNKESEDGVHPLTESLNIDWRIRNDDMVISEKDSLAQDFSAFKPLEF